MSTQVPTNSQDGLGGHPPESNPNTTVTEHWHELVRQCTIESFVRLLSRFAPDVSSSPDRVLITSIPTVVKGHQFTKTRRILV